MLTSTFVSAQFYEANNKMSLRDKVMKKEGQLRHYKFMRTKRLASTTLLCLNIIPHRNGTVRRLTAYMETA